MEKINIDKLIAAASAKLGISPEKLRNALNSGNMSEITAHLSQADKQKLNSVMKDSETIEKLKNQYFGK